jgi:hypothetical protein
LGNDITVINGVDAGNNDTVSPGWDFIYPPVANVSIGPNSPPAGEADFRDTNVVIMQLAIEAANEDISVDSIVITGMGSGDEKTEIQRVYLYMDEDNSGTYSAGDSALGSGQYAADNGRITFPTTGKLLISEGSTAYMLVACDLDVFTLAAAPITAAGASSGRMPHGRTWLLIGLSVLAMAIMVLLGKGRRRLVRTALLALLLAASVTACVLRPVVPATFQACVEARTDIKAHGDASQDPVAVIGAFPVMGSVLTVDNVANGD